MLLLALLLTPLADTLTEGEVVREVESDTVTDALEQDDTEGVSEGVWLSLALALSLRVARGDLEALTLGVEEALRRTLTEEEPEAREGVVRGDDDPLLDSEGEFDSDAEKLALKEMALALTEMLKDAEKLGAERDKEGDADIDREKEALREPPPRSKGAEGECVKLDL